MTYGINPLSGRCRRCGRAQVIITTDGGGGVVERPNPCACPKSPPAPNYRQRAAEARTSGLCMDCGEAVEGMVGKALRCGPCKQAAIRRTNNRVRSTPEGRRWRREYERRTRSDPEYRARRNAWRREREAETRRDA